MTKLFSPEDEEQENDDACSNDPAHYEGVPPSSQVDPLNQAVDEWESVCTWSRHAVPTPDSTGWTRHCLHMHQTERDRWGKHNWNAWNTYKHAT